MTTKQTGHTLGRWQVHAELNVVSESGRFIASCGMNSTIKNEVPQSKANARLIAAAPELLEVLKDGIESLDFGGEPSTAIGHAIREFQAKAKQALAKAEGETR